jgi:hypothetical protein
MNGPIALYGFYPCFIFCLLIATTVYWVIENDGVPDFFVRRCFLTLLMTKMVLNICLFYEIIKWYSFLRRILLYHQLKSNHNRNLYIDHMTDL